PAKRSSLAIGSRSATQAESAESGASQLAVSTDEPAKPEHHGFHLTWWYLAAAILVLSMLSLMWPAARYDSATMDEQNHISRGLVYLRTGSLKLNRIHPPLINMISAIPLALDHGVTLPLNGQGWSMINLDVFAMELLWQTNDGPSMVRRARVPIMILAALLALIIFAWASEMYGRPAGALAMTLAAFCPNILAHGHL